MNPLAKIFCNLQHMYRQQYQIWQFWDSTLVLLNPDISCLCKQCRSRLVGFDLDLHCLPLSMWTNSNNPDQAICLAENFKWVCHLNLFSRTRVNNAQTVLVVSLCRYISCCFSQKSCSNQNLSVQHKWKSVTSNGRVKIFWPNVKKHFCLKSENWQTFLTRKSVHHENTPI